VSAVHIDIIDLAGRSGHDGHDERKRQARRGISGQAFGTERFSVPAE
jgi:hypothetical protein